MTSVVNSAVQYRWAAGVCAGIHAIGSRRVVYVPDNPLSHVLRTLDESFGDIQADGDVAVERPGKLAQRADLASHPVPNPLPHDHQHEG